MTVMLNTLDEILKRQAKRKSVFKRVLELGPPLITDPESVKEHKKLISELQNEYLDACFLVDRDIDILRKAVKLVAIEEPYITDAVAKAAALVPLDAALKQRLEIMEAKKREQEAKENKASGKSPGQRTIYDEFDDQGKEKGEKVKAGVKGK